MQIKILSMGRQKAGPYAELLQEYTRRLTTPVQFIYLEVKKKAEDDVLRRLEAEKIKEHILPYSYVIALDERGQNIDTPAFAQILKTQQAHGAKELVFVIGGAYGLDEQIRQRADAVLSFGKLVWPHQLVRVMLIEQIYRAYTIIQGHPYHK